MLIKFEDALETLRKSEKILLTAHINPDGDATGSTLAMMQILRAMGKTAQIYIDDKLPKNFLTLPFVEEIHRPESGEKFSADLLLVLDTSPDRIARVADMTDAPVLNIDHHVTNKGEGVNLYVEPNAAATCEIVYKFCRALEVELTKEIATCLYTGLATDTGFFTFSNTSAETLRTAAELVSCGVKPNQISEQMERKSFAEVRGMSAALQTTKIFYGGKVAGMFLDLETAQKFESTEGFIDMIRVIDGVEVAFMITCKAENFCRVSMRSKGVDVSKIANSLGGGGHIRAAGCTLHTSLAAAKETLVKAIGEFMLESGNLTQNEFAAKEEVDLADFES